MKTMPKQQLYRVIIHLVLGYEATGCLTGGAMLILEPDGRLMKMPVSIMHGAFVDFLFPGIILGLLGLLNGAAFLAGLRKSDFNWTLTFLALGALLGWFWIEIAILQRLHWLHAMWSGPVIIAIAAMAKLYPWTRELKRKVLLVCGILASFLYIVVNLVVASLWNTYNAASQTISELSAIGAPTRFIWITLCTPYTLLMLCFAWGVLLSAGKSKTLKITGYLLLAYALLGILWPFAPMHQRQMLASGGNTITDQMHLMLGAITELLFLLALFFAATVAGKVFRIYSSVTFISMVIFGMLTFREASAVAANQPTPLIGVWERINVGVFLLWVIVFALNLLQKKLLNQHFKYHKSARLT